MRLLLSFYPFASEQFCQSSTRHLECHVAGEEETHDVIADDAVPGEGSVLLAGVVRVVDGGVVDHEGDHEVDVDPQRVVEHEPDEGEQGEDVADRDPGGAGRHSHGGDVVVTLSLTLSLTLLDKDIKK